LNGSENKISQNQSTSASSGGRSLPSRIERRIRLARVLLVWERLWSGVWAAASLFGLLIAAALFGIFENLPLGAHWALLAAFSILIATALWNGLRGFSLPDRAEALQHLETASGLTHHPLSAYEDTPAPGSGDYALWQAYQNWVATRLNQLKIGFVTPGLSLRDPYGLRAIVILLLVIGFVGTEPGQSTRIVDAFFPGSGSAGAITIEAWITPPGYTGKQPIYLEQGGDATNPDFKPVGPKDTIKVPVGSILSLRAHGLRDAPSLETSEADRGRPEPLTSLGSDNFSIDTKITASAEFSLTQGGRLLRGWTVETIPDQPPTISFAQPLTQTASGSLHFAYKVSDDYGVTKAEARIALVKPPGTQLQADASLPTPPEFRHLTARVAPPVINLPLKSLHPKSGSGDTYVDLMPHPWAGLPVTITLIAKDDTGQEGTAPPVTFTLPARKFTKPLAAAVIEQRRDLALNPTSITRVARVLNDLTIDGARYIPEPAVYINLRAAYWRLTLATRDSDLDGIYDLLWDVALRIEDGDISIAESDLRRARDALAAALASGAGEDEINQLLNEMKEAFKRYMDALAARGQNPDQAMMDKFAPQDGQTISRDQLEKMLGQIAELAKSGSREEAQKMLDRMQAIMENMQTPDQNRAMSESEKAMAQAVDGMSKMIDKQRALMDETFRESHKGNPGENGPSSSDGGSGKNGQGLQALKDAQKQLRSDFQSLLKELEKTGVDVPKALGEAGKQMENAEERLGNGRADRATLSQGQAIKNMRDGTQGLVDKLSKSMMGQRGQAQSGRGNGTDPLGRGGSPTTEGSNNVPDQIDRQRARSIIEELRRRASELGRPKVELDYLDRLLNQF